MRASGPQERPLPTLNAVLMPTTTGLPPRLQRRTCSRNRFSFLLSATALSSSSRRLALRKSAVHARSPFSNGVFGRLLSLSLVRFSSLSRLLTSVPQNFSFPSPFFLSFARFRRRSSTFSLSLAHTRAHHYSRFAHAMLSSALALSLSFSFWLTLLHSLSLSFFPSLVCMFACTLILRRLIHFLFIVALAVVAHDASFGQDLSLYRVDRPRQGRRFGKGDTKYPTLSEFRTVSV